MKENRVQHQVRTHSKATKNTTGEGGAKRHGNKKSSHYVSESDVRTLLERIGKKEISGKDYIPVRISTPGIVCERLFARNNPLLMPVSKAYQAMSPDNGPKKGKNVRGHGLSVDDMVEILKRMDSPDFVFSQPHNDRGIEVIKYGSEGGNIAVIIEFDNNVNAAYTNGYGGGAYNIAISTFEIDGGAVGLFEYAREKGWQEVFNKEKEGDPAKKFPATRPFAIEQDLLNESLSHFSDNSNTLEEKKFAKYVSSRSWQICFRILIPFYEVANEVELLTNDRRP